MIIIEDFDTEDGALIECKCGLRFWIYGVNSIKQCICGKSYIVKAKISLCNPEKQKESLSAKQTTKVADWNNTSSVSLGIVKKKQKGSQSQLGVSTKPVSSSFFNKTKKEQEEFLKDCKKVLIDAPIGEKVKERKVQKEVHVNVPANKYASSNIKRRCSVCNKPVGKGFTTECKNHVIKERELTKKEIKELYNNGKSLNYAFYNCVCGYYTNSRDEFAKHIKLCKEEIKSKKKELK